MVIDQKIFEIVKKLENKFLISSELNKEISIFLCGGASKEEAEFRCKLGDRISSIKSKYRYSVFYPESLFLELILGHKSYDLLSLENLLANSVNTVVIPLQSPGTFTELGAFSNHSGLNNKLTIIIDPKYEHNNSFINTGPIRYLKKNTDSQIIFNKMDSAHINLLAKKISESGRKISKKNPVIPSIENPLTSYEFYYATIFILDPIPKRTVLKIASILTQNDSKLAMTVAETVINTLIKGYKIVQKGDVLTVPKLGVEGLVNSFNTVKRSTEMLEFMSDLRYKSLNRNLRGKRYLAWKGAA